MEQLLIAMVLLATALGWLTRHAIPVVTARRIARASLLGLLASGSGLGLLLVAGFSPLHPFLWAWLLICLLLVSLCAAPFGVAPLVAARRRGGAPPAVE